MENYKLVLGLEIHMHVNTPHGMFCGCSSDIYDAKPNTHTCPVCLGLPGALPVPNQDAVRKTQLLGLALNCEINKHSRFDRKHYFYPDLPKGFQLSQYKQPLCVGTDGVLERIHLEEDTAKSFHQDGKTLIDFNKSGTALIELVTRPVFTSAEDAVTYAKKIRDLARYLGVSNADMEKGQMRIEPNISVRTEEMEQRGELPNYKVEVKNINSFRFMEKAVNHEFERQKKALENGEQLAQENRGYDEKRNVTVAQRSKEEAHDYRYFPEPDIPPMEFSDEYLADLKAEMPELPHQINERLLSQYKLSENSAKELTKGSGLELLSKFEELAQVADPNKVANLLLNKPEFREFSVEEFVAKLTEMDSLISDSSELEGVLAEVIRENTDAVVQYLNGKETTLHFLLGQAMKKTKGKADPQVTKDLLISKLAEQRKT